MLRFQLAARPVYSHISGPERILKQMGEFFTRWEREEREYRDGICFFIKLGLHIIELGVYQELFQFPELSWASDGSDTDQ